MSNGAKPSEGQLNLDSVEKLIELVRRHGMHQIEVAQGDFKISVTATPPTVMGAAGGAYYGAGPMGLAHMGAPAYAPPPAYVPPAPAPAAGSAQGTAAEAASGAKKPTSSGKVIKSPFVGTFYRSSTPGGEPFVSVGTRVKKGTALCIIEAMKLMNEIEAEADGVVKEILTENEQPVEFDQPLFVIE